MSLKLLFAPGQALDPANRPGPDPATFRFGVIERHRFYNWCERRGVLARGKEQSYINRYFNLMYAEHWNEVLLRPQPRQYQPLPGELEAGRGRALKSLRAIFKRLREQGNLVPVPVIWCNVHSNVILPLAFYHEAQAKKDALRLQGLYMEPVRTIQVSPDTLRAQ